MCNKIGQGGTSRKEGLSLDSFLERFPLRCRRLLGKRVICNDGNMGIAIRTIVNDTMPITTKSPQEIIHLFNTKEVDESWSFVEYKPSDTGKWTHGYHRYPAKFIPQLVERLFDEYVSHKEAHINDPFMGCGTTIVTAISKGFKASGTDINKIAHLITKVKSTPIESIRLGSGNNG